MIAIRPSPRKRGPRGGVQLTLRSNPWIPAYAGMSGAWKADRDYITRFILPQPLSADQMPRSSRKRSIGADDLIELMR